MSELFPVLFSAVMISILGAIEIFLIWSLNRPWWKKRWIRNSAICLPVSGMGGILFWAVAVVASPAGSHLRSIGTIITSVVVIFELALMFSLPISGILHHIHFTQEWLSKKFRSADQHEANMNRRTFLKSTAAVVPVFTILASGTAVASSFAAVRTPLIRLSYHNLPPAFEGFRILHLTDMHLGYYAGLQELEAFLLRLQGQKFDLILLTGDVSDKYEILPRTLKLISELKPAYGTFASVGNHEYYRGIKEARKIFETSPIPLLLNQGVVLPIHQTSLYIAGTDDPAHLGRNITTFMKNTVDQSLVGAPSDVFHLLMSHRPDGFNRAAELGVHLTLSGHTHGGQIGFNGRSAFESMMPQRYLWGHYQKKGSQLYTSAGFGHWFPFRLGCPAEAPIYVLTENLNHSES
ncbi:MAG: metallophosphoesterase [Syntrophales bacterium]